QVSMTCNGRTLCVPEGTTCCDGPPAKPLGIWKYGVSFDDFCSGGVCQDLTGLPHASAPWTSYPDDLPKRGCVSVDPPPCNIMWAKDQKGDFTLLEVEHCAADECVQCPGFAFPVCKPTPEVTCLAGSSVQCDGPECSPIAECYPFHADTCTGCP